VFPLNLPISPSSFFPVFCSSLPPYLPSGNYDHRCLPTITPLLLPSPFFVPRNIWDLSLSSHLSHTRAHCRNVGELIPPKIYLR
jgi:hypothetical protein